MCIVGLVKSYLFTHVKITSEISLTDSAHCKMYLCFLNYCKVMPIEKRKLEDIKQYRNLCNG
jgi:hypothetical protein